MLHAVNATRLTLFRHQARRNLGTAFAKGLRCARNRRNGRSWSHGIQVMRSFRQLLVLSACRCLRQQAILVARVPDRPAGAPLGSIRTTALMKKPGATNA